MPDKITYHYDNPLRDEISRITYSDGSAQRSYTYYADGQLHTAANAASTITYGYDAAGRTTSETQAFPGGPTGTFAYAYDTDGNLARHTRPDGSLVDYQYNARNLLENLIADTAPPVATYEYNGRNQLSTTAVENGSLYTATRSYDNAGRLTGLSNGAFDSTGYTLSADGRRTAISRNGSAETYGYDLARQVTSASQPVTGGTHTNAFAYDAAGNRSSATTNGSPSTYTANSVNEYTAISGQSSPTYDPNGNLLTGQVLPLGSPGLVSCVFSWTIHNELATATNASGDTAAYQYDALGRRVKTTSTINNTQSSIFNFHNGWNVELEHNGTAYTRRNTWGLDLSGSLQGAGGVGGLVMLEDLPSGGGAPVPHFPAYDGNGNITTWITAGGAVEARLRYDSYGNIIEQTGTAPAEYGFSTKPMDAVTGLLYYGYRYYDPVTGRWPSRDTIGEEGGVNLYEFVGNDGVNKLDLLGLTEELKLASKGAGAIDPLGAFAAGGYTVHESRDNKVMIKSIIDHFDTNGDKVLDKNDECPWRIRMVGYSWGGWSVLLVIRDLEINDKIKDKSFLKVAIGTLDPVGSKRNGNLWGTDESVSKAALPAFVKKAYNVYQRNGSWRQAFPLPDGQFKGSWVNGAVGLTDNNQDYSKVNANFRGEEDLNTDKRFHDHISIQLLASDLVNLVDKVDLK